MKVKKTMIFNFYSKCLDFQTPLHHKKSTKQPKTKVTKGINLFLPKIAINVIKIAGNTANKIPPRQFQSPCFWRLIINLVPQIWFAKKPIGNKTPTTFENKLCLADTNRNGLAHTNPIVVTKPTYTKTFSLRGKLAITYILIVFGIFATVRPSRADLWGADLPLLAEIVTNTLQTYYQLRQQTLLMEEELRGIRDTIRRFESIKDIIQPHNLAAWKDPTESLRRLQRIYYSLPPEFRTEKSDEIERQISGAMSVAGNIVESAQTAFRSGKQLERDALTVGPAVANKMAASGVGTLVALESQNQVAQATIISLLSQMIAEEGSRQASKLKSQSQEFKSIGGMRGFSENIKLMEISR